MNMSIATNEFRITRLSLPSGESEPTSLRELVPLIQEYQQFYLKRNQEAEKVFSFFSEVVRDPAKGFMIGAWDADGNPAGFSTVYLMPSSLSCAIYACMNDLYVRDQFRGRRLGKKIMAKVSDELLNQGIKSFDWMTQKSNQSSQKLYDSLGAVKEDWAYYSIRTPIK